MVCEWSRRAMPGFRGTVWEVSENCYGEFNPSAVVKAPLHQLRLCLSRVRASPCPKECRFQRTRKLSHGPSCFHSLKVTNRWIDLRTWCRLHLFRSKTLMLSPGLFLEADLYVKMRPETPSNNCAQKHCRSLLGSTL